MSKLSLHISNWMNADLTYKFIEKTQPSVIKVFGDGGLDDMKIREAKHRSSQTLFVGRVYFPTQLLEQLDEKYPGDAIKDYDPQADAQNVFQQMQPTIAKINGLIDVWEGLNEVPLDDGKALTARNHQKARAYSAFTVALAKLMHNAGQKLAAYSFSTGNPVHLELWDDLLEGLRASDYLALHEYIAPDHNWQNFYTGMCNRYRKIYAQVPDDVQRPIIITECGDDYFGSQGYRGMIPEDLYLSHLKDYDTNLMQDPYVIGATIFCYGINAPQWKSYDIGGDFTKMLAEYIAATPTPVIEPPKPKPKPDAGQSSQLEPALSRDKARWWTEEAIRKLEANQPQDARAILVKTVIPWFYASMPNPTREPDKAQVQDQFRWYTEEAVRQIEANEFDDAQHMLKMVVIPWFYAQ